MATVDQVMAELAEQGTEQQRRIYERHGAPKPQFGVKFADLRPMAKRLGTDDELARALWATANTDARLLACMVADPSRMSEADLDGWLADIDYYVLVDVFVGSLAGKVPGVRARADRWMASSRDWTAQAGWDLVGVLAATDPDLDDAYFLHRLATIEGEIDGAGNRTRHAMNGALIAIGIRDAELQGAAMAAGARIGQVVVDHGKTGCVTPDACSYIEKTVAYRETQAAKRAARTSAQAVGAG
ncbi:MAG TPA: DNA alkylation repair protein [Candidatus Limnocylindrales bacterium]